MKAIKTKLGYDAVKSNPRRRNASVSTKSEDRELTVAGRQALSSMGRDLVRNLSLAGFVLRTHNQTVATLNFKCAIPNQAEYNELVKRWMYHWSHRSQCDVSSRHSLTALMTLAETHRVIDGDVGILKCRNGKLQIIEGDRIRNPATDTRGDTYEWIHGVKVGNAGQAYRYAIHQRKEGGGFEFEREVSAEHLILCGYFNRIDQIRGVSLLAPAINKFRDVYESIDYALAKAKLSQLLGFKTTRLDDTELTEDGLTAIQCGLTSSKKSARLYGNDFDENIIETAEASRMAQEHGVFLAFTQPIASINIGT